MPDLLATWASLTMQPYIMLQRLHEAGAHVDPLVILLTPCALFLLVAIRGATRR